MNKTYCAGGLMKLLMKLLAIPLSPKVRGKRLVIAIRLSPQAGKSPVMRRCTVLASSLTQYGMSRSLCSVRLASHPARYGFGEYL